MLKPIAFEPNLAREILYAPGSDGVRITFGVLDDGRCAVVKAGCPIEVWNGDRSGIAAAIAYFQRLTTPRVSFDALGRPLIASPLVRRHRRRLRRLSTVELTAVARTPNERVD